MLKVTVGEEGTRPTSVLLMPFSVFGGGGVIADDSELDATSSYPDGKFCCGGQGGGFSGVSNHDGTEWYVVAGAGGGDANYDARAGAGGHPQGTDASVCYHLDNGGNKNGKTGTGKGGTQEEGGVGGVGGRKAAGSDGGHLKGGDTNYPSAGGGGSGWYGGGGGTGYYCGGGGGSSYTDASRCSGVTHRNGVTQHSSDHRHGQVIIKAV